MANTSAEKTNSQGIRMLSPTTALSMMVAANLTTEQYCILSAGIKGLCPEYSIVQKEKRKCYPEDIFVAFDIVGVKLQHLLDITARRICTYLEEKFVSAMDVEKQNLQLFCQWGCGGSQQQRLKRRFEDITNSDGFVFFSWLVPLKLVSKVDGEEKVWWHNLSQFSRPIRLQLIQETDEVTQNEISHIEDEVKSIEKTAVPIGDGVFQVKHTLSKMDAEVSDATNASTVECDSDIKYFKYLKHVFKRMLLYSDPVIRTNKDNRKLAKRKASPKEVSDSSPIDFSDDSVCSDDEENGDGEEGDEN